MNTNRAGTPSYGGRSPRKDGRSCTFDLAIEIDRSPDAVYAVLADVQDVEPIPRRAMVRMVKEPPGTTGVGTRWHERVRLVPGYWLDIESLVTGADRPRRMEMDFRSRWFHGHLTYLIDGTADRSILRQHETLRPRFAARWQAPFIARRLLPRLRRRLADIKKVIEAGPA